MEYRVVFDIADAGYRNWDILFLGLGFVLLCVLMLKFYDYIPTWPIRSRSFKKGLATCCLAFSVYWTFQFFFTTYVTYRGLLGVRKTRHYEIKEGLVTDFVPMNPSAGSPYEKFTVEGKEFKYSDDEITGGFNMTHDYGGPIRPGLHVRVWYTGDTILRLEIGEIQNKSSHNNRIDADRAHG